MDDRSLPQRLASAALLAADLGIQSISEPLQADSDALRRSSASAVLIDLVLDQDAPAAARERALGRLAAELARRPVPGTVSPAPAPSPLARVA